MTHMDYDYTYTGEDQYHPPQDGVRDPEGREYFPYFPDPGLKKAVNLAIGLQRPLLLEGEPGCGKTRVAGAIAYELTQKNLCSDRRNDQDHQWWNFYSWNVTSTSRARDGLYSFDAVGRLRDAQLIGSDPVHLEQYLGKKEYKDLKIRLSDKTCYLQYGPFGSALKDQSYRPILLIDEIDKADSDFPNDLLLQLDEMRFRVSEIDLDIPPPDPSVKPIILITSNREKPLPEPFLRRCLYYYVNFPQEDSLRRIVRARFGQIDVDKQTIVDQALEEFGKIRHLLERQPGSRPPGTSELLEFLTALIQEGKSVQEAMSELEGLMGEEQRHLLGILIKTKAGQDLYTQAQRRGE